MSQILKSLSLLCLFSFVNAQYGSPASTMTSSSTPSSTTSGSTAVQTVIINGLVFTPDTLSVSPGGKVEFHFEAGNHSVAQASFEKPCQPLSENAINSGFVPLSNGGSPAVFTVTVNDTNPIWIYCGQHSHCQSGMVGVINPPSSGPNTLAAFKASAANTNGTIVPASVNGGVFEASASSSASASASTSGASTSGTSASGTAATGTSTISSSSPTHTGEARTLAAWTDITVLLLLSTIAAMFMI